MSDLQTWTFPSKRPVISGPWDDEPDKAQWIDDKTGLDCLIVRGPMGALCGYVGVPPEHPWHMKGYAEKVTPCEDEWCYEHTPEGLIEVHGGLTYSNLCATGDPVEGICHVAAPGRPERVWWFGFDCSHYMDLSPRLVDERFPDRNEVYREFGYVQGECASLAEQLAALSA